jgi:hypothetical protein
LPRSLQIVAEPKLKPLPEERPAAPAELASTAADNAWQQGLDLSVMQQRYPLLRNNAL